MHGRRAGRGRHACRAPGKCLFRRASRVAQPVSRYQPCIFSLCVVEAWLPWKSSYARVADTDDDKEEPHHRRRGPARACRGRRGCPSASTVSCRHSVSLRYLPVAPDTSCEGDGRATKQVGVLSATAVFTVAQFIVFPFISHDAVAYFFPTQPDSRRY